MKHYNKLWLKFDLNIINFEGCVTEKKSRFKSLKRRWIDHRRIVDYLSVGGFPIPTKEISDLNLATPKSRFKTLKAPKIVV